MDSCGLKGLVIVGLQRLIDGTWTCIGRGREGLVNILMTGQLGALSSRFASLVQQPNKRFHDSSWSNQSAVASILVVCVR